LFVERDNSGFFQEFRKNSRIRILWRNGYSTSSWTKNPQEDVILPGITSSWKRNPPEELLFLWESPALGRGIVSAGN
jgi:hypothetical protein